MKIFIVLGVFVLLNSCGQSATESPNNLSEENPNNSNDTNMPECRTGTGGPVGLAGCWFSNVCNAQNQKLLIEITQDELEPLQVNFTGSINTYLVTYPTSQCNSTASSIESLNTSSFIQSYEQGGFQACSDTDGNTNIPCISFQVETTREQSSEVGYTVFHDSSSGQQLCVGNGDYQFNSTSMGIIPLNTLIINSNLNFTNCLIRYIP